MTERLGVDKPKGLGSFWFNKKIYFLTYLEEWPYVCWLMCFPCFPKILQSDFPSCLTSQNSFKYSSINHLLTEVAL